MAEPQPLEATAGPARQQSAVGVAISANRGDLDQITRPDVQAVICTETTELRWLSQLAERVRSGGLHLPRARVDEIDRAGLAGWLDQVLAHGRLEQYVLQAFVADILSLADWLERVTGADHFAFRIFTEEPTTMCGFHVDTVPPGAPTIGVLRLYNGDGTRYLSADNVTSATDFYRYLRRRERREREREPAFARGDVLQCDLLEREIAMLDRDPGFLRRPGELQVVPTPAIVAFKHLDVREHWQDASGLPAWIHCSPMAGELRLVLNLSPARAAPPSARRGKARSGVATRDQLG